MKKSGINKKKQVEKKRKHCPKLMTPPVVIQNIEQASLDIELQHRDKTFVNAMEKLTTTEFVESKINEFKKLMKKANKFKRLQGKCEYYIMNFGFGLRSLCNILLLNGDINYFQINVTELKDYIEEYLSDYLENIKEDIAGIINPFEIFDAEIAEEKLPQYLVA